MRNIAIIMHPFDTKEDLVNYAKQFGGWCIVERDGSLVWKHDVTEKGELDWTRRAAQFVGRWEELQEIMDAEKNKMKLKR